MSSQLAPGWHTQMERGPDWIFVRLLPPETHAEAASAALAEAIWRLLEQEFTYRLVLELDALPLLSSHLLGELIRLSKRIYSHGGMLRICGLSDSNQHVLRLSRMGGQFPHYASRAEAVMGHRPAKPR
jgi:anti-anti-sigma factor